MRLNNHTLNTLTGFLAFVFVVILIMSVFKGKSDQRVEELNFFKSLFGWKHKGSTPNSTINPWEQTLLEQETKRLARRTLADESNDYRAPQDINVIGY